MTQSLFIHYPDVGPLRCFQVLAIMNKPTYYKHSYAGVCVGIHSIDLGKHQGEWLLNYMIDACLVL